MKEVVLPEGTEMLPVQITGNSNERFDGSLVVKRWTNDERRKRAVKRTIKLVGTIFACSLIGLFVHILLIIIIPGLLLTLVATAPIFMKFMGEEANFFQADGECPYCHKKQKLRPYLDSQLREKVTLQCPECGQTSQGFVALQTSSS